MLIFKVLMILVLINGAYMYFLCMRKDTRNRNRLLDILNKTQTEEDFWGNKEVLELLEY
jgi:hypothetical protein